MWATRLERPHQGMEGRENGEFEGMEGHKNVAIIGQISLMVM